MVSCLHFVHTITFNSLCKTPGRPHRTRLPRCWPALLRKEKKREKMIELPKNRNKRKNRSKHVLRSGRCVLFSNGHSEEQGPSCVFFIALADKRCLMNIQ